MSTRSTTHQHRVLTTLLVTVITTIIVTVTVPEATDAVAVLALELILFTLSGSYVEERKEIV